MLLNLGIPTFCLIVRIKAIVPLAQISQECVTSKFKSERLVSFSEIGFVGKKQALAIRALDFLPVSESFVLFNIKLG